MRLFPVILISLDWSSIFRPRAPISSLRSMSALADEVIE
jgi:hypothetical protein